jgi:hypothetical protein
MTVIFNNLSFNRCNSHHEENGTDASAWLNARLHNGSESKARHRECCIVKAWLNTKKDQHSKQSSAETNAQHSESSDQQHHELNRPDLNSPDRNIFNPKLNLISNSISATK